ncbi:MAG: hypothetical protein ACLUEQ_07895, partial [Cloacibacillus evryensis]
SLVSESKDKNFEDYQKFNFIYMWIAALGCTSLLCLYQPFMKLWVGEKLMLPFYYVVLFAAYFFIHKWMDMLHVYLEATGIWWQTRLIPLLAALVNIALNLILVKTIGLPGVIISTIISIFFIYNLGYLVAIIKLFFKKEAYLPALILRQTYYLFVTIISATLTYLIAIRFQYEGAYCIVERLLLCVTVPNIVMMLFYFRLPEFKKSMQFILCIIKRRKTGGL